VQVLLRHGDYIDEISDDMRDLIARRWPHLLTKLKPPPKQ
jgi:hypothetical protein